MLVLVIVVRKRVQFSHQKYKQDDGIPACDVFGGRIYEMLFDNIKYL
jgi:hypothetical protein